MSSAIRRLLDADRAASLKGYPVSMIRPGYYAISDIVKQLLNEHPKVSSVVWHQYVDPTKPYENAGIVSLASYRLHKNADLDLFEDIAIERSMMDLNSAFSEARGLLLAVLGWPVVITATARELEVEEWLQEVSADGTF